MTPPCGAACLRCRLRGQLSPHATSDGGSTHGWSASAARHGTYRRVQARSEEHTSELQSRLHLVCRLLLEKKKKKKQTRRERHRGRKDHAQRGRAVRLYVSWR